MLTASETEYIRGFRYSPVLHLASIESPRGDWDRVLLTMLTACFDASGSEHDQQYLVVAGFISSISDWLSFEEAWEKRLQEDGIRCFHAVEFAQSFGEFEHGWKNDESRRRRLSGDLMVIIQKHVYRKFGEVIVNSELSRISQEIRKAFLINAYSLAGRTCVGKAGSWANSGCRGVQVGYVFESGDAGKGALMTRMTKDGYQDPIFQPKRDHINPDGSIVRRFVPLQAADWWAYELFKACKQFPDRVANPEAFRWGMTMFDTIHGEPGLYTAADLEELEKNLRLHLDMNEWAGRFERRQTG